MSPEDKESFEKFKGSLRFAETSSDADLSFLDDIDTNNKKK